MEKEGKRGKKKRGEREKKVRARVAGGSNQSSVISEDGALDIGIDRGSEVEVHFRSLLISPDLFQVQTSSASPTSWWTSPTNSSSMLRRSTAPPQGQLVNQQSASTKPLPLITFPLSPHPASSGVRFNMMLNTTLLQRDHQSLPASVLRSTRLPRGSLMRCSILVLQWNP